MRKPTFAHVTGIDGINTFKSKDADKTNWHIFTVDAYVGFTSGTAREWMVKHGAKLIGFTGNGITVEV